MAIEALAAFAAAHHAVFTARRRARRRTLASRRCDAARCTRLAPRPRRCLPHAGRGDFLASPSCSRAAWTGGDAAGDLASLRGRACTRFPAVVRDPIEITCVRWDRSRVPGLVVHESRRLDERRHREVDGIPVVTPELLVLAARVVEAVRRTTSRRSFTPLRRKRLITYESTHATFDCATLVAGCEALRATADRARAVEPGQRARPRARWRRCCSRRSARHDLPEPVLQYEVYDRNGAVRRPRRRRAARMEGRRSSTQSSRSTSTSSRARATTAGATRSWPRATGRSMRTRG